MDSPMIPSPLRAAIEQLKESTGGPMWEQLHAHVWNNAIDRVLALLADRPPELVHESRSPDGDGQGIASPADSRGELHPHLRDGGRTERDESAGVGLSLHGSATVHQIAGSEPADSHSLTDRPLETPGWQPIETAPNHERVLLSDGHYVVAGEVWDGNPMDDEGRRLTGPTHWRSLPEPSAALLPPAQEPTTL